MNTDSIMYFVMDVDGTLTDGKIYIGSKGELIKVFNVKDGYAISNILIPNKILPIIITGRKSKILERRCKELRVMYLFQGIKDKKKCLDKILNSQKATYRNVAYIGDDINDIECMKIVKIQGGKVGCPSDAVNQIKEISDFISVKNGGDGAVREFVEWIIQYRR